MGLSLSRRQRALLGLVAAALTTGCPPVNPPNPGPNPNQDADRKEIRSLFGDQDVATYFQSRLINDGVGIFNVSEESLPAVLPRRWGRSYALAVQGSEENPADAVTLKFLSATEAEATYTKSRGGKLVLDYTWQRKLVSKPFVESSLRTARFSKVAGAWRLSAVNVARVQPDSSGLRVGELALVLNGQPTRRFRADSPLPVGDLPVVKPDQGGRIEAQLSYEGEATDPAFYAFLSVPPMTQRLRMRDDGQEPDVKANDGVYTAQFFFPSQPGVRHLVIDAIAGKTFADSAMSNYDATQWGIPYRVQGGEAR